MAVLDNWPFIFSGVFGVSVATLITWVLYIRERQRRNLELIASCFPNIVNFSFNFMEDNTLKFRTLFETTIDEVAQSPELGRILQLAAEHCSEDDAFFSEPEMSADNSLFKKLERRFWASLEWGKASEHLHLAILNALSARYSDGHFGHALLGLTDPATGRPKHPGIGIVTESFCFGLTCEKNRDVRARKIRVMIAAKDFLKHQVDKSVPRPQFERPGHWVRWETMLQMKRHMELEEEAAAKAERITRKVWEVSLSFIVPTERVEDVASEVSLMSHIEVLRNQVQTLQDQLSHFGPRLPLLGPRGADVAPLKGRLQGSETRQREEKCGDESGSMDVYADAGGPPYRRESERTSVITNTRHDSEPSIVSVVPPQAPQAISIASISASSAVSLSVPPTNPPTLGQVASSEDSPRVMMSSHSWTAGAIADRSSNRRNAELEVSPMQAPTFAEKVVSSVSKAITHTLSDSPDNSRRGSRSGQSAPVHIPSMRSGNRVRCMAGLI